MSRAGGRGARAHAHAHAHADPQGWECEERVRDPGSRPTLTIAIFVSFAHSVTPDFLISNKKVGASPRLPLLLNPIIMLCHFSLPMTGFLPPPPPKAGGGTRGAFKSCKGATGTHFCQLPSEHVARSHPGRGWDILPGGRLLPAAAGAHTHLWGTGKQSEIEELGRNAAKNANQRRLAGWRAVWRGVKL